jgi:hypothetical protein
VGGIADMSDKNTIVLILCAGDAIRMNGVQKQLLPIGQTTILGRILNQMYQYDQRVIVVTHDPEIALLHDLAYNPENRNTTCETLLSTSKLWDDRTIVLLGDVIYSREVLNEIVNCHESIKVFGNSAEIFALVFDKDFHEEIKPLLHKGSNLFPGKLRCFFHAYCNFEPDKGVAEPLDNNKVFFRTHDWTMDVDNSYEYERAQLELVDTRVIEELPI